MSAMAREPLSLSRLPALANSTAFDALEVTPESSMVVTPLTHKAHCKRRGIGRQLRPRNSLDVMLCDALGLGSSSTSLLEPLFDIRKHLKHTTNALLELGRVITIKGLSKPVHKLLATPPNRHSAGIARVLHDAGRRGALGRARQADVRGAGLALLATRGSPEPGDTEDSNIVSSVLRGFSPHEMASNAGRSAHRRRLLEVGVLAISPPGLDLLRVALTTVLHSRKVDRAGLLASRKPDANDACRAMLALPQHLLLIGTLVLRIRDGLEAPPAEARPMGLPVLMPSMQVLPAGRIDAGSLQARFGLKAAKLACPRSARLPFTQRCRRRRLSIAQILARNLVIPTSRERLSTTNGQAVHCRVGSTTGLARSRRWLAQHIQDGARSLRGSAQRGLRRRSWHLQRRNMSSCTT